MNAHSLVTERTREQWGRGAGDSRQRGQRGHGDKNTEDQGEERTELSREGDREERDEETERQADSAPTVCSSSCAPQFWPLQMSRCRHGSVSGSALAKLARQGAHLLQSGGSRPAAAVPRDRHTLSGNSCAGAPRARTQAASPLPGPRGCRFSGRGGRPQLHSLCPADTPWLGMTVPLNPVLGTAHPGTVHQHWQHPGLGLNRSPACHSLHTSLHPHPDTPRSSVSSRVVVHSPAT